MSLNKIFMVTKISVGLAPYNHPVFLVREKKEVSAAMTEKAMLPTNQEVLHTAYTLKQILNILAEELMED